MFFSFLVWLTPNSKSSWFHSLKRLFWCCRHDHSQPLSAVPSSTTVGFSNPNNVRSQPPPGKKPFLREPIKAQPISEQILHLQRTPLRTIVSQLSFGCVPCESGQPGYRFSWYNKNDFFFTFACNFQNQPKKNIAKRFSDISNYESNIFKYMQAFSRYIYKLKQSLAVVFFNNPI